MLVAWLGTFGSALQGFCFISGLMIDRDFVANINVDDGSVMNYVDIKNRRV